MEQSVEPPTTSQANRIIETYNIYSVNKVLLQQILETIGQITKKTLDKKPTTGYETETFNTRTIQTAYTFPI